MRFRALSTLQRQVAAFARTREFSVSRTRAQAGEERLGALHSPQRTPSLPRRGQSSCNDKLLSPFTVGEACSRRRGDAHPLAAWVDVAGVVGHFAERTLVKDGGRLAVAARILESLQLQFAHGHVLPL